MYRALIIIAALMLAQAQVPTPVIRGGTIDNAPIGSTIPSTGSFTTLSTTGNTIFGGTVSLHADPTTALGAATKGYVDTTIVGGFPGTAHDHSGTITLGGNAQTVIPANANRLGCSIQLLGLGDLWVSVTGSASIGAGSYDVPAGSIFTCPVPTPTGNISVFALTTGTSFTAIETTP